MISIRTTTTLFGVALITAIALPGCDSKDPTKITSIGPPPKSKPDVTKPAVDDPAPEPPKPQIDRAKIPDSLKSDAYYLYGLSNEKPLNMEISEELGGKPSKGLMSGALSARLTYAGAERATFATETTGNLHDKIGDEMVDLKKDGIYEVSSDSQTVTPAMMELPSKPTVGKSWKIDSEVMSKASKSHWNLTLKVMGIEPLTIAGKAYQAVKVQCEGTVKFVTPKEQSFKFVEKEWYVKDIGMVKTEVMRTIKGEPAVSFVIAWKPSETDKK